MGGGCAGWDYGVHPVPCPSGSLRSCKNAPGIFVEPTGRFAAVGENTAFSGK